MFLEPWSSRAYNSPLSTVEQWSTTTIIVQIFSLCLRYLRSRAGEPLHMKEDHVSKITSRDRTRHEIRRDHESISARNRIGELDGRNKSSVLRGLAMHIRISGKRVVENVNSFVQVRMLQDINWTWVSWILQNAVSAMMTTALGNM
jgi:hypothetical protein